MFIHEGTPSMANPEAPRRPSTPPNPELFQDDRTYELPKTNKRGRNLALGAVAAGVTAAVAAGAMLFGNNASAERSESKRPAASAPANPSHEASPTPSEKEAKPEKLSFAEAREAFEAHIENNAKKYETVTIDFEKKNTEVALGYLDAVSDWTMAGTSRNDYEAWNSWREAGKADPNLSTDDWNSIPNSVDVGIEIADVNAQYYVKNPLFKEMSQEEGVETIKKLNARNIQLAFEAYADQDLEQGNPDYKAHLEPVLMTEAIGTTPIASIQFEPVNNTGADLVEAITVEGAPLSNNNLHVFFDLPNKKINWSKVDPYPAIGAGYGPVNERVAADTSTPESR